jgi:hypothetical protein
MTIEVGVLFDQVLLISKLIGNGSQDAPCEPFRSWSH